MKIIERGVFPEDHEWKAICGHCRTRFECFEKEGQVELDQRDGNYLKVACPVCSRLCYGSPK